MVPLVGVTEARRQFDQRMQYGLQVERRAADRLEHIGSRGLLLRDDSRSFVEQARVLDRNDGLISEARGPARSACR